MTKENNVKLLYLKTGHDYQASTFIHSNWEPSWYCQVYQVPAVEMLSRETPDQTIEEAVADELIRITMDGAWTAQYKRPIRVGDMVMIGDDRWIYCKVDSTAEFEAAGMRVVPLKEWHDISIVSLMEVA